MLQNTSRAQLRFPYRDWILDEPGLLGHKSQEGLQSEAKILGTWLFSGFFGAMWLQNALLNPANPLNQCFLHCSQYPSTRGLLRTQLAW